MKHELVAQGQQKIEEMMNFREIVKTIEQGRIRMEDFVGMYPSSEIESDLERCHRLELIFEEQLLSKPERREQVLRGLAAEYTFYEAIQTYEWLSQKTKLIRASKFDDFVGGIDAIAEMNFGNEQEKRFGHIGLAVDFTVGSQEIINKLKRTFQLIDLGLTPSVKYFRSTNLGFVTNLQIPRIIIGADEDTFNRLVNYSSEISRGSGISQEAKIALRNDPFRYLLWGQILGQLSVFENRLKNVYEHFAKNGRLDIAERAQKSLRTHSTALSLFLEILSQFNVKISEIHQHIKRNHFANEMAIALSQLSKSPVSSYKKENL